MKNLACVKSIITLMLTLVFSILCFYRPDDYTDTMKSVITCVITFYFAHQIGKSTKGEDNNGGNDTRN